MRWGKRKPVAADDKRPRCRQEVRRGSGFEICNRLARTWSVTHQSNDLGELDCCQNHCDALRERGFTLVVVDRRKKKVNA